MKFRHHAIGLALGLCFSVLSGAAVARLKDVPELEEDRVARLKETRLEATPASPVLEEAGVAYEKGDYATVIRKVRPLAIQGDFRAQGLLGWFYSNGQGVAQDYQEGAKWCRLAAEQGHALAQFMLGVLYNNGQGVVQDYQEAAKWYRRAARTGRYPQALSGLGVLYNNGQGVAQDYQEAAKWYQRAALLDGGDVKAQFGLGVLYNNGQGVAQNYKEAVKWYRLAAEQGYANAQFNLGVMYAKGQGVAQNSQEAAKWHRLAAGQGMAQDYQDAAKWYRLAAEQGYSVAQSNLGAMYEYGRGVPSSSVAAYALYSLAAAHDPSSASKASANQTRFAQTMSAKEIEAGQALTHELSKPGNLLKALDQYVKTTVSKSGR